MTLSTSLAVIHSPAPHVDAHDTSSALADGVCVAGAVAGDTRAFGMLYTRYQPDLVQYAASLPNMTLADAADVVQDVFLRLWRNCAQWRPVNGVPAYLFGAVRNACRDRSDRVRVASAWQTAQEPITGSIGPATPEDELLQREVHEIITHTLATLPAPRREVYLLRKLHGQSITDIAAIMRLSVKAVRHHMSRAERAVFDALVRAGY